MERSRIARTRRPATVIGVLLVVALLLAACGSGTGKTGAGSSSTVGGPSKATTLGVGVTATSVKVGVSLIDFSCVAQFTDSLRFGQPAIYQTFIDYVNQHGGVADRKIVPVYKLFCPIGTATVLAACTSLTEDSQGGCPESRGTWVAARCCSGGFLLIIA